MRLVLASKSATRRAMLEAAGIAHEVRDMDFDEDGAKAGLRARGADARAIAAGLAEMKARHADAKPGELILGADQVLERDDATLLHKPRSRDEAAEQLCGLGGRTHQLHSAAAIVEGSRLVWSCVESAALTMRPLGDDFIQTYLDREYETIRYNVGGYRIEGPGVQLFEMIEGSHFAILGLPLLPLLGYLRERGLVPG